MFRRSFEPLVVPYKEQLKWWSSIELGRRFILVLFIVSFPQNKVYKYSQRKCSIIHSLSLSHTHTPLYLSHSHSISFFSKTKYPAAFVLMITAAVYGYIQPFTHTAVNILESSLSINTLVLLLLRNTGTIEENLGTLGKQSGHKRSCGVEGVTDFAWLLMPMYYLTLLVFCAVGTVWTTLTVRLV